MEAEKTPVLIVDDEYINRLLLEELLVEYDVASAEGATEMWQCLSEKRPDLILMDIMMPGEDGFSLASKLHDDPRYTNIPIIFVTAKSDGKDVETGFDLGGRDYVRKPFSARELTTRIKYVLEKNKAENILQKKSFAADKIIDVMLEGMFQIDEKGFIFEVNPAFAMLMDNDSKQNIVGKHINDYFIEDNIYKQICDIECSTKIETVLKTPGSNSIPIVMSVTAMVNEANQLSGYIGVIHDVTKQKMTEQTLIDAKNVAEQADKLKSLFLANISHEIRTPMNSIVGFSELLSDPDVAQNDRSEYISIIQKNCETLLNLIDNLLDISQIEAGQMSLTFSNCKINQMLDDLYANFSVLKEKQGKSSVSLRVRKHIEDTNFSINCDNFRLQQIIMNLVGNALKFTSQGYVEFGYIVDYHNSKIKFYVKDSGIGIPDDKMEIIFDRFGKVEHKGEERQKGTGLGLAISKNLAELLGGKLYVKSKYGEGSTFYLELNI